MKKYSVFLIATVLLFSCWDDFAEALQVVKADFYVAPNGSDDNTGTIDRPFASLVRARDAVRKIIKQGLNKNVTVLIRAGTYRLKEPLVFGPQDSGTSKYSITYAAYPGESPVISGGKKVSGWNKQADGTLWTAELPQVKSGNWYFRQLFVNGRRRNRARFPSEDTLPVVGSHRRAKDWAGIVPDAMYKSDKKAFQFKPGDIRKDWTNIEDVEVVVLQFWMEARLRIDSIDEQKHVVHFTGGSWRPLTWSHGYYVDNVFEGLDVPGSWYLDRRKGLLNYHPLTGEDMNKVEVMAPVSQQLVRFEGNVDARRFVRNVTLRGLTFCYTRRTLPEEGHAPPQAEITVPAAIHADGALHCRIEQCRFEHLGTCGIEFRRGCKDNVIVRNTMFDIGAGCIKIGEPENCKQDVEETSRTVVSDNRFLEGGQVYLGSACVWLGQSSANTVSHNEISGPFMWAVSAGWTWSYFPLQRARDNIIEFNHVHHLGTGILGTHGAIYTLGSSPGTVIRNNYIHHIFHSKWWKGAGEGIILDNGCTGILVENNLVHDAVSGGYGSNFNCFGNIIQNNIFAYGKNYQLTRYGDAPSGPPLPNGEIFARNIVVWKEGQLFNEKDWWSFKTLWDYNLYYHSGGEPVKFMKYSFEQWKAKGLDAHSIIADPLFVDQKNGDFSLRPQSPAFKLGFRPIDISRVGPRS